VKAHRTILISGLPLVLWALLAAPAPAAASTLLSGYGGPGQGNQAILGSALLSGKGSGGSRGSGSGGSRGSGASTASETSAGESASGRGSSGEAAAAGSETSGPSSSGSGGATSQSHTDSHTGAAGTGVGGSGQGAGGASGQGGGEARAGAGRGSRAGGAAGQTTSSLYPASERVPAGQGAGALGLSGSQLLYIILALVALLFTAALTKGLTRADSAGRRG
jgi:hypothetical protein